MSRCCCGKYDLKDDIAFVSNGYQHEIYGPQKNFCGPSDKHDMRNMHNRINQLEAERDRLKADVKQWELGKLVAEPIFDQVNGLRKQLQARDSALEKAKDNFIKIKRQSGHHGIRPGFQVINTYADEALRAIEAAKEVK